MGHGFDGPVLCGVDVPRTIVRQRLRPAARVVMTRTAIECAFGVKLFVEQPNAPFNLAAAGVEPVAQNLRPGLFSVGLLFRVHADSLCAKFLVLRWVGLVGAVTQQGPLEGRLEQRIEPVDVVPIARYGEDIRQVTVGGKDEVFAHPVKVQFQ